MVNELVVGMKEEIFRNKLCLFIEKMMMIMIGLNPGPRARTVKPGPRHLRTRPDPGQNRLGPHKGIPSGEARQCTLAGTEPVHTSRYQIIQMIFILDDILYAYDYRAKPYLLIKGAVKVQVKLG